MTLPSRLQYTGLIAATYHEWDRHEPGRGHAAQADEWMTRLLDIWFRATPPVAQSATADR